MTAIVFDTHKFVERLIQVRMPKAQAEVLAETHTNIIENLATKQDLEALADRLTIRFLIMLIAMFFSIIGVIKYLL